MKPAACAIALALLCACSEGGRTGGSGRRDTVEVGYSALRISLPVFVAYEEGLYARRGLDVRLKRYDTAQPLVEEVLDGRIEAGGYAAIPIVLAAASRGGSRPQLATAVVEDEGHPISVLLRRRGDSALSTVADLAGRRVGVLPTVAYQKWLGAVLRKHGVDESRVEVMPIAPAQQAMLLAEGGVDALFTNDPMATAALASGVAEAFGPAAPVPDALGGRVLFGAFLVGQVLARDRPAVANRLVRCLDEAIALIARQPARARRAMRAFVRPAERAYVDRYPLASYLASHELTADALKNEVSTERRLAIAERAVDVSGWLLAPEPEESR